MGESIYDSGTDTKAGERAGARHESDFGDVLPSFAVFLQLILNERQELFGEVIGENVAVLFVV